MKKILFAIPLFAMLLVACDPIVDEISPDPNVTPENLTTFRLFLLRHVM